MKILILGKTGQLGEELYTQAIKLKHNTIAFSHDELDIKDSERVKDTILKYSPEIVVNATAYHVVPDCETNPEMAFLVNSIAVRNIAQITDQMNIPLITYSTDYIFDGKKGNLYTERDLPSPVQTYGVSKVAGEYLALSYNSKSIVIRTSGVYGGKYGSKSKKGNFALNILKEKNKKILEVSSEQIVNPTYSSDLAKATYQLVEKRNIAGIYHLINEGHCSWAEFTEEIMKLVGSKTKIIPVDRSGNSGGSRRPLFSALKNVRARKLGVVLPHWKEAIGKYIKSLED